MTRDQRSCTIEALFALPGDGSPRPICRDAESEAAVRRYVSESAAVDRRIQAVIGPLAASRQPILVWGTGTHTLRLLAGGGLDDANIVAFVDSNPRYHGRTLAGRPVIAPAELAGRKEAILISSRGFQREIERTHPRQPSPLQPGAHAL